MLEQNPGGSLGDKKFPMPNFITYSQLLEYIYTYHGYESSNNLFFKDQIKGMRIAEVGCGHGFMTLVLAQYALFVSGFDVDSNALLEAENLKQKLNINNVEFRMLDEKLNSIASYDAAISMDVIEHVPNPISYLTKINSMIKKGGKLFLGTPNGLIAKKNKCIIKTHSEFHVMEYTPGELIIFLREAMFRPVAFYSNKNISGKGYDISISKRIIIRLLCKVGLFDTVSTVIQRAKKNSFSESQISGNSFKDWVIEPIEADNINAHNCDAIIIEAEKE